MSFFDELKRRNVIRVAAGYIVIAWLVVQVVETIFPAFGFGDEAIRFVVTGFAVGFIPVVVLAWVFEWTPDGIRKDDGDIPKGAANLAMARRWDRIVMVILAVAVAYFIVEKILWPPIEPEPAIVVLPFEGIDLPPESEDFPAAIAEGLYTSLARIPQLVVSAWPTVMRLADDGADSDEIVATLNAANFMQGSVELADDRLILKVSIVETASGRTIWQDTYEGTTAEIFEFQYEIVAAAAENLQLGATGVLYEPPEINPEASRLTVQAWSASMRVNMPNQTSVVIDLLERALEIDPDYPPALLALALARYSYHLEAGRPKEAIAAYNELAERVYAIDREHGVLNVYEAWGLFWEEGYSGHANHHLQVALRTGLNDPEALRMFAGFARRTGHPEASVWFGKRAIAINPTCENCVWQTTENLFYARQFEEAIAAKKQFQAFGGGGYGNHAYMLLRMGQPEAALELIQRVESVEPWAYFGLRAMTHHALGDTGNFANYVARLEQEALWIDLAQVYAFTGDVDLAFEVFGKEPNLKRGLIRHLFLPQWDNLRDDPRWAEVREELGMSEEKLAVLDFSPVLKYEQ